MPLFLTNVINLAAQFREQVGRVDRFSQNLKFVPLRPRLFQEVRRCGLTGEEQNFALRQFAASYDGGFDAGHASHNDIADEHIWLKTLERLYGLLSTENGARFESRLVQNDCEGIRNHLFVICYEYPRFCRSGDCWICHAEFPQI